MRSIPFSFGEGLGVRLVFVVLLLSINVFAGNPSIEKAKADFKKVNQVYLTTPSYSMDIQYQVYDAKVGGNLIENKPGTYYKSNGSSYTKMLNIETIVNSKTTIIANNDDRFLVITDTRKNELSPIQTNIDTMLKLCDEIKINDIGTTKRHYALSFGDETEVAQIDLYINLTSYTIEKLVIFYNETLPLTQNDFYAKEKKPRLEIIYKSFKSLSAVNEALFAESTYLSTKGTTYKGNNKYSNYKIVNQLNAYRFKK